MIGIDQFSNLEGIAGRILGCYEHGPTFFVREILDGIAAQPGGDYIHSVCRHRQALQQSRENIMLLRAGVPLVQTLVDLGIFSSRNLRSKFEN